MVITNFKSINIGPWGLIILAFFMLSIGFEELMFVSEDLVKYQYVPGIVFTIFGAVMFATALLAYWNGKKQYCTLFLWIAITAPIISMLIGVDGSFVDMYVGLYTGSRGVTYGIILALVTFLVAAWMYFQKNTNKHIFVILIGLGLFALFEGIANNFVEMIATGTFGLPEFVYEDAFRPMKVVAAVFAILTGLVAGYLGFVKPEFIDKTTENDDAEEIKSFNVKTIATMVFAFAMVLLSVNGILYACDGFKYQIVPGFFIARMGLMLFFIAILAYWNGEKNNTMIFIWLSAFMVAAGFLAGIDSSLVDQIIDAEGLNGGMPFFVINKGLLLGVVFGIFTLILTAWAYLNEKRHLAVLLALVAIAGILIGYSTTCLEYEDFGNISFIGWLFPNLNLKIVTALGDGYVPVRVVGGIITFVAACLAVYIGIVKPDILGKADCNESSSDLKTVDISAIGMFVIAFCLVMAGIGGIKLVVSGDIQMYFIPSKLLYFVAFLFTSVFILLSFWHGNKITTVFMIIIAIFSLSMIATSMGNKYGIIPSAMLLLFLIVTGIWMYRHCEKKILITAFFGLLALSVLLFIIGNIIYERADNGNMECAATIIVGIAGLVLAYISIAKMDAFKLPVV